MHTGTAQKSAQFLVFPLVLFASTVRRKHVVLVFLGRTKRQPIDGITGQKSAVAKTAIGKNFRVEVERLSYIDDDNRKNRYPSD